MHQYRRVVAATAVAGTLDILSAVVYSLIAGRSPADMLRFVASGPAPAAAHAGIGGALVGLLVHFAIMAVIADVFVLAADRAPVLKRRWVLAGLGYGLLVYLVMTFVVLALRFGLHLPGPLGLAEQLFSHLVLVGLPIAWFARQ